MRHAVRTTLWCDFVYQTEVWLIIIFKFLKGKDLNRCRSTEISWIKLLNWCKKVQGQVCTTDDSKYNY